LFLTVAKLIYKGDRLLGNRGQMNVEVSHFNMFNEENHNAEGDSDYSSHLAKSLFGESVKGPLETEKILALKTKAPAPRLDYHNNLRVVYSQNISKPKPVRCLNQKEERTLDAPGILDDYYLNLIDWSLNNNIAVALGPSLYLWNAEVSQPNQLFELEEELAVTAVSWSPMQQQYLAVGTEDCLVQVWDVERELQVRKFKGHSGRVGCVTWNEHLVSSGSFDSTIINWDVRLPKPRISTFSGHHAEVCGLKWNRDGTQLASGGNDNLLNVWSMNQETPQFTMEDHLAAVKAIAWCPWQPNLLASGGGTADKCIKFWNTQTGVMLDSVETDSQVCSLLWSTLRKELISSHGFSKNQLAVWKYPTMKQSIEFTGHTSRVLHMALSPDGSTVMSASADETLKFWRISDQNKPDDQPKKSTSVTSSRGIRSSMNQIR
ncbi:WD40 repeat domain-containing protein, partial [Patescibacteria group bacterium]|nr:WD40 repeat domain-containing protein [Patescibacteria group bacterium]